MWIKIGNKEILRRKTKINIIQKKVVIANKLVITALAVFVVLSTLLLLLTRPFVEKFVIKKDEKVITNAFSIIGKQAKVTKTLSD